MDVRLHVRPWGLWSARSKTVAGILLLSALVGIAAYLARLTQQPYFGAISAAIAAGALFVAAYSAYSAVGRSRRKGYA